MAMPQKVNIRRGIKQKLQGMSYKEIADSQGVCKAAAVQAISPILRELAHPDTVEYYRKDQAQILDGLAAKCVASIVTEDYTKASLKDKIISASILIDKSRLIQGQSTSNSSIMLRAVMDTLKVEDTADGNGDGPVDNS